MKQKLSPPSMAEMESVLVRTTSLLNLLLKDVRFAIIESKDESDELKPYRRRTFIRTFFSLVEGYCFCYRNLMLNFENLMSYKFSDQEILKLKELREATDRHSGEPKQIKNWLEIEENLKISFEWTAKFVGTEFKLDTTSDGYKALLKTKKVRNDLMHPKRTSCLVISESEHQTVEEALKWFIHEMNRFNGTISPIRSDDLVKAFARHCSSHALTTRSKNLCSTSWARCRSCARGAWPFR